jgi:hypothetical protein
MAVDKHPEELMRLRWRPKEHGTTGPETDDLVPGLPKPRIVSMEDGQNYPLVWESQCHTPGPQQGSCLCCSSLLRRRTREAAERNRAKSRHTTQISILGTELLRQQK